MFGGGKGLKSDEKEIYVVVLFTVKIDLVTPETTDLKDF